jgi:hypothetical protein
MKNVPDKPKQIKKRKKRMNISEYIDDYDADEVLKETIDLSENMLKKSLKLMNQSKTTKFLRIIKTNYI